MKGPRVLSGEQLIHCHLQVSQVPEDPEDQAEEDDEGSWEDKEIPKTDGGKDPNEEQDEACNIQEQGNEEKQQAPANERGIIHRTSSRQRLCVEQVINSFGGLSVWHVENVKEWTKLRGNAFSL